MISNRDTQQPEWTVARSFRLLRPIISRKSTSQQKPGEKSSQRITKSQTGAVIRRPRFGDSPNPRNDPDWMHKPRKLVPRQYSRLIPSSSSDPVIDTLSGTLSIPTPLIQRTVGVPTAGGTNVVTNRANHSGARGMSANQHELLLANHM